MFTWLPMQHLPAVPQYFVDLANRLSEKNVQTEVYSTEVRSDIDAYNNRKLKINGQEISTRVTQIIKLGDEWDRWVQENIVSEILETGFRVSTGTSEVHGAHCDFRRKWKLYYLVSRGGESATTHFYRQKNHNIVREEITDQDTSLITVSDYSELEIIDSVQWPLNQWVCLNPMILHGVTGITGNRTNFNISIPPKYNLLFEQHK